MKHVLFVHDRQGAVEPRRTALEASGYRVSCVPGLEGAREVLAREPVHVVLLDVLLEGPNGFEACRRLREHHPAAELPILMSSRIYRDPRFAREALAAGAQGYLLRPLTLEDLVAHIERLTGRAARAA